MILALLLFRDRIELLLTINSCCPVRRWRTPTWTAWNVPMIINTTHLSRSGEHLRKLVSSCHVWLEPGWKTRWNAFVHNFIDIERVSAANRRTLETFLQRHHVRCHRASILRKLGPNRVYGLNLWQATLTRSPLGCLSLAMWDLVRRPDCSKALLPFLLFKNRWSQLLN